MADEVLAALDVGTNSFHLVVARVGASGAFEVLGREKEMVRLGSGGGDMKLLASDAIDRGVDALHRFRAIAEVHGADLRAVATSAVREAENRGDFLDRARVEAGVEIEVVSGVEEARLIHLGVLQAVPVFDRRLLLCDIGGGSTELLVGHRGDVLASRSLKLGAIRLTRRFFDGDRLHPAAVGACRRWVASTIAPLAPVVARLDVEVAVGSSGTVGAVCAMAAALDGGEPPRTLNASTLTADALDEVVRRLAGATSVAERAQLPGLDDRRADIILAGAIILEQIVAALGIDELVFSEYALREGVLLDTWRRRHGGSLHHLSDLRRASVLRMADVMDEDRVHSEQVARLALRLFDELEPWHGLGADARERLEAAALLANVGLFVSHAQHHKHSYYLIRHSEHLAGFTDREIELIAQVARYHRKSAPKRKHPEFAALDEGGQREVSALAGLLRLAVGLDRRHAAAVADVAVADRAGTDRTGIDGAGIDGAGTDGAGREPITIEVAARDGADVSLELFAAGERRELLESVLGAELALVLAHPEPPTPPVL